MLRTAGALALAIIGLCIEPPGASAQQVGDTLATWGRLGAWAVDCATPASNRNTRSVYVARNDRTAFYVRDYGAGRDTNEIVSATVAADGALTMTIDFPDLKQRREVTFVKGTDGRIRAFQNRLAGGEFSVRGGKFLANGNDTPWQSRCD